MIAIDSNVLLRYLLQDDKHQSQQASALVTGAVPVLVTNVVLVETVWVLTGKRYSVDCEAVAGAVSASLEESKIIFEDGRTVWRALNGYKEGAVAKSRW